MFEVVRFMGLCPASSDKNQLAENAGQRLRNENREELTSGVFPVEPDLLCNLTRRFYSI